MGRRRAANLCGSLGRRSGLRARTTSAAPGHRSKDTSTPRPPLMSLEEPTHHGRIRSRPPPHLIPRYERKTSRLRPCIVVTGSHAYFPRRHFLPSVVSDSIIYICVTTLRDQTFYPVAPFFSLPFSVFCLPLLATPQRRKPSKSGPTSSPLSRCSPAVGRKEREKEIPPLASSPRSSFREEARGLAPGLWLWSLEDGKRMGTGWRKAFCTSVRRDTAPTSSRPQSPSPRAYSRLRLFSSSSSSGVGRAQAAASDDDVAPATPGLRCRTATSAAEAAEGTAGATKPQCGSGSAGSPMPSPRPLPQSPANSNPCSPRSPSRFSLLRNSFRLSKSRCGICLQSVKAVQGTAVFIAECSHSFHFPCISTHVRKQQSLVCPVCAATWRQVPLLPVHPLSHQGIGNVDDSDGGRGWTAATTKRERGRDLASMVAMTSPKTSSETKGYSDDEPLLSPGGSSASRFNTIPEAEEDEDDEEKSSDNEFQGLSATSAKSPLPSERQHRQQRQETASTAGVRISVNPDIALLSTGRNHDKYVVSLKLKALSPSPPSAGICRAPIDLVLVLDVAGAMTGAKLQMLKRSIRQVILSLTSCDRLSLVAFASTAKRLFPLRRMTIQGQRAARRIVDRLVSGVATSASVGDALRKATRILEDRRERNPVSSIMLLSDGQQQQQSTEKSSSSLSCRSSTTTSSAGTRFAHIDIPVNDSANGPEQEPPEEAFARCVGGLLSVIVHDVCLQLTLPAGEITALYSISGQPVATITQDGLVKLGDLYADEERDLLVEMRILSSLPEFAFKANCNYRDPATQESVRCGEMLLPVVVPPTSVTCQRQRKPMSAKAEKIRNLFVATRAVTEARRLTGLNDTGTALHLLSSARSLLLQSAATVGSGDGNLRAVEVELAGIRRRQHRGRRVEETVVGVDSGGGEALTPTSAWRAAEKLARLAIVRKSLNRVSDLHGFEDARF